MRTLKITEDTHILDTEIDKRLEQAASGRLTDTEREELWSVVNDSDEAEAIQRLAGSYEYEILATIRQLGLSGFSLDEMLGAGKSSLANMISQTPAHLRKPRFEKFGMWWIKQGILASIR